MRRQPTLLFFSCCFWVFLSFSCTDPPANDDDSSAAPTATYPPEGDDDSATATHPPEGDDDSATPTATHPPEGDDDSVTPTATRPPVVDQDEDGYKSHETGGEDCDDTNPDIHPGAGEVCDGIDNDCDALTDELDPDVTGALTWYADTDADTYGNPDSSTWTCDLPDGYVRNDSDCDDSDAAVNPSALEVCNEKDDDCDGLTDEGLTTAYYPDRDGDGFGGVTEDGSDTVYACTAPFGYLADSRDCDDGDWTVHPGATEVAYNGKNDDCNASTPDNDLDGDGHDHQEHGGDDCDDVNATVYPGAVEACDAQDNDCDGEVDEGLDAGCLTQDNDQDGYSVADGDCDDGNAAISPGATEVCDGVDNDCDEGAPSGGIDEGLPTLAYAPDEDQDGFGASGASIEACAQPSGYVTDDTDCDDGEAQVHPGATEICDGVDNNCEDGVDEGVLFTYYRDRDGDGFGVETETSAACTASPGYVPLSGDCDDYRATVNPDASETCNGLDDNCDGEVDEGVTTTYYVDDDGDGYGSNSVLVSCTNPGEGYSQTSGDCDDGRADICPGYPELCDEADNDCNGIVDDGVGTRTFYKDSDGDGYGIENSTQEGCALPAGYSVAAGDCNDGDQEVNPAASDECDDRDNDCDGLIDESCFDAVDAKLDGAGSTFR